MLTCSTDQWNHLSSNKHEELKHASYFSWNAELQAHTFAPEHKHTAACMPALPTPADPQHSLH